jgi:FdhD protein
MVTRCDAAGTRRRPDRVIVEEPLTIQLDGELVTTTMRTPGNDFELAAGFCFTEGLLAGAAVTGVRYCADGPAIEGEFNVVTVETGGRAPVPAPRLGMTSSSCGLCGRDQLDALTARLVPFAADREQVPVDVLAAVPAKVLDGQGLFGATGAVHAAAAFDAEGSIVLTREDVGRHNAVDKVVGAMLLDGTLPARSGLTRGLFISGRASIEMVQKAWAGGFRALVAVSAPTSLAVDAARRANLALVGFVRPDGFNVYAPA